MVRRNTRLENELRERIIFILYALTHGLKSMQNFRIFEGVSELNQPIFDILPVKYWILLEDYSLNILPILRAACDGLLDN